ncbi:hypothetical protein RBA69_15080 [Brenneria goodwinii]|uniref:hypothetical protein n=1 Tax=Brenneria goodwinii TaxID=1109412 RepID=UPI0036E4637A
MTHGARSPRVGDGNAFGPPTDAGVVRAAQTHARMCSVRTVLVLYAHQNGARKDCFRRSPRGEFFIITTNSVFFNAIFAFLSTLIICIYCFSHYTGIYFPNYGMTSALAISG